jgi:hypothetical protein
MREIFRFIEPGRDYGTLCYAYVASYYWMVKISGACRLFGHAGKLDSHVTFIFLRIFEGSSFHLFIVVKKLKKSLVHLI